MLKLDFSLVTTEERAKLVNTFFFAYPNYRPRQHELNTITNYILYGKDPYINKEGSYDPELPIEKWTNMPTRKEIEIATKHQSWKKQAPASLDEVLENPAFNEAILLYKPVQIKQAKPSFDRAQEADIPSIEGLWATIDLCISKLKDPEITPSEKYRYTHMLIEFRREQYVLRDIFKSNYQRSQGANRSTYLPCLTDSEIDWENALSHYAFAPMGLYHKGDLRFEDPLALANERDDWGYNLKAPHIIDLREPSNIDILIKYYSELLTHGDDHIDSSQNDIIHTLDYYIKNTKFTPTQLAIVSLKQARQTNEEIARLVNAKFNKTYRSNYISTIYQKACIKIAETVKHKYLCYYERINPTLFKKCSHCGQLKLRSPEEFMRKARNSDGFSSRCKECDT